MPTRKAEAEWLNGSKDGSGRFKTETGLSGSYSFPSRFEQGSGSNPEELLAAADAACFGMALTLALEKLGTPPKSLKTEGACTIVKQGDGFRITKMKLTLRADVPGVDPEAFRQTAEAAKNGCPVSTALKGNVEIELDAALV
jgi:osmotically inducible protein OsmC